MINDPRFINVFNDCLDRLSSGTTVEECLALYPEFRQELMTLLSAGLVVRQLRANPLEVQRVSQRIDSQLQQALSNFDDPRSVLVQSRLRRLRFVAAIVVLGAIVTVFGLSRLPKEEAPLTVLTQYPTKIITPSLTLTFTQTPTTTQSPTSTATASGTPTSTATASGTPTPTATASGTPTFTATPEPTETPTYIQTNTPTTEPMVTVLPNVTLMNGSVEEQNVAPQSFVTPTPTCTPKRPNGWESYTIQASDTLFSISLARNITLDRLIKVNCINNPNVLRIGQRIWVPAIQGETAVESGAEIELTPMETDEEDTVEEDISFEEDDEHEENDESSEEEDDDESSGEDDD